MTAFLWPTNLGLVASIEASTIRQRSVAPGCLMEPHPCEGGQSRSPGDITAGAALGSSTLHRPDRLESLMTGDNAPRTPNPDESKRPSQTKMGFGNQVASDLFKDPNDVPKAEVQAVIRCPKRHQIGVVTRGDELVLPRSMPTALSSKDDVDAWCPHPGCPPPPPKYKIEMVLLKRELELSRRRRQTSDILITDIATVDVSE